MLFPKTTTAAAARTASLSAAILIKRRFSSSSDDRHPEPLFLWLGSPEDYAAAAEAQIRCRRSLLLPVEAPEEAPVIVDAPETALELVNRHYESEQGQQFVGGMGETDPGVFFSAAPYFVTTSDSNDDANNNYGADALEFAELVKESIRMVKQERHGVPFGLYTSGLVAPDTLSSTTAIDQLGLDTLQVSLFAGSPNEYAEATGSTAAQREFGQVCGFIAQAVEQGQVGVEVGILQKYAATGARELATSLGAQHVHVFSE